MGISRMARNLNSKIINCVDHESFTEPPQKAVLLDGITSGKYLESRTKDALERASRVLIDKVRELSLDEASSVSLFPSFFIDAARIANDYQISCLARRLSQCCTVEERVGEFDSIVDEYLSNLFTQHSYQAFFCRESPARIEARLSDKQLVVRLVPQEMRRVSFQSLCSDITRHAEIDDVISSIFLLGGRHSTIEDLLHFDTKLSKRHDGYVSSRYHYDRKEWVQYGGNNKRGQISYVLEEDQMSYFTEVFWDWVEAGSNVLIATVKAYLKLMEYFVIDRNLERSDVICLDSFVKTLINESSNENFEDNDALEDIAL
ncbi:hypothetical protein EM89_020205 [Vibrio parahaemolyticus]|nr:hypothetical protein VPUCM_p0056 [Vibrio parahaemolyticus UCM-V493]EGR1582740.1 hypothetical protein [Vibrio parahaemolyticus]OQS98368.1 hypothetical protein EN04_014015 [Vibrio parahaemolyticus O4:K12 str. K1203]EGR1598486.1 hypothetical protein [Vibrio parahaemolyticus]EGR1762311.1 hypothetical protein [Vibrio parahaemolyticus]